MLLITDKLAAGVDEVGRGCLAGPVVAAAVIMPFEYNDDDMKFVNTIKDSKKLSKKKREMLSEFIKDIALDYKIAFVNNQIIDEINIRNASMKAMQNAISELSIEPEYIYVDGNYYKSEDNIPYRCVEQGDNKIFSIACASILAKVARDAYVIDNMAVKYENYNWENNKCYGTKEHYDAIKKYGITPYHRESFTLYK